MGFMTKNEINTGLFDEVKRLKAENKELKAVVNRLGTIISEEFGSRDTQFEDEINHLIEKQTLFKK